MKEISDMRIRDEYKIDAMRIIWNHKTRISLKHDNALTNKQ